MDYSAALAVAQETLAVDLDDDVSHSAADDGLAGRCGSNRRFRKHSRIRQNMRGNRGPAKMQHNSSLLKSHEC